MMHAAYSALVSGHFGITQDELNASRFSHYMNNYGKSYGTKDEFEFRMNLFALRDQQIEDWNADPSKTHKLSHNKFSDWTEHEMKRVRGFKNQPNRNSDFIEFDVDNL